MAQDGRMGWFARAGGQLLDAGIPGGAFNPNAPSFGEGWLQSRWGQAFRNARKGNFRDLSGEVGGVLGGRALPIVGPSIGRGFGTWMYDSLAGKQPTGTVSVGDISFGGWQPSGYGPYAGGYQGLPAYNTPSPGYYQEGGFVPNFSTPGDEYKETGYPGITSPWGGDSKSPSASYGNGLSGGQFGSGLSWGGGTGGAMLQNLGLAGGVKLYGGNGGDPSRGSSTTVDGTESDIFGRRFVLNK